jgi:hypothetical protein
MLGYRVRSPPTTPNHALIQGLAPEMLGFLQLLLS